MILIHLISMNNKPFIYWFSFGAIISIAILMRISKKDLLNLKFNNKETYWIKKSNYKSKMKNQF